MTARQAALHYATTYGWPIMPVKPCGKEPLTPHGVNDATTDPAVINRWFDRYPDCNIAVACGHPGPQVLDIDDLSGARFMLTAIENSCHPPEVATGRGRHCYFQGTDQATITLGYGELRGRGSYIIMPPSVHSSGKLYTWLAEPNGQLPAIPDSLIGQHRPAGVGELEPRERVAHGERHDHLKDVAVRLLRAGITDAPTIERHLKAEYEAVCDPHPPAKAGEFQKLAEWATKTQIAQRERNGTFTSKGPPAGELPTAPGFDAALAQHKAFVAAAGGWAPHLDIVHVERFGNKLIDALIVHLSGARFVEFARQGDITVRGAWTKAVIAGTNGLAAPPQLKDWELNAVYRSLCILAGAPAGRPEAEDHEELLGDLLALCELVVGHNTQDAASIFRLIETLRARLHWDPGDRNTTARPALVATGDERYLRAGELHDYFRFRGAGIAPREFLGRMSMIGVQRIRLNGREARTVERAPRKTNTALLYRLPVFGEAES